MVSATEGSKVIALRPGKRYRLFAHVAPRSFGTHRIRLDYRDQEDVAGGRMYRDYSNRFLIE